MELIKRDGLFFITNNDTIISKGYKCEADAKRFLDKQSSSVSLFVSKPSFEVNERFEFLSKLTSMVILGIAPSLVITGEPGMGKTKTVRNELDKYKLTENEDYVFIKGYSTAKGLYRSLFENNGKIVVFDDCDSILKDSAVSINILKAALDSYDVRTVTWNAESFAGSDLPSSFEFTGKIIFISNFSSDKIDSAIKSRALNVDLSMTAEEKITRMRTILPFLIENISMDKKLEALNFLEEHKDITANLNMRTLENVIKIRASVENDWERLALYTLVA